LAWIIDLLPNDVAAPAGAMVEQRAKIMKQTLERAAA
jgi:hypothetical protein